MSRVSKKIYIGEIAYIELTTIGGDTLNQGDMLTLEIQDESGGLISPLTISHGDTLKISKLFKEMASEIKALRTW